MSDEAHFVVNVLENTLLVCVVGLVAITIYCVVKIIKNNRSNQTKS